MPETCALSLQSEYCSLRTQTCDQSTRCNQPLDCAKWNPSTTQTPPSPHPHTKWAADTEPHCNKAAVVSAAEALKGPTAVYHGHTHTQQKGSNFLVYGSLRHSDAQPVIIMTSKVTSLWGPCEGMPFLSWADSDRLLLPGINSYSRPNKLTLFCLQLAVANDEAKMTTIYSNVIHSSPVLGQRHMNTIVWMNQRFKPLTRQSPNRTIGL